MRLTSLAKIFSAIGTVLIVMILGRHFFSFQVPAFIKSPFQHYLTVPFHVPKKRADALYILGGSAESTRYHVQTAARLLETGKADRILILGSLEKWEYDPSLHRNLTHAEWIIQKLVQRGVPKSSIETVPVHDGFFGTFSEAQELAKYLKKKSYHSVILISSPCHTRRVKLSFDNFLRPEHIAAYIVGSQDKFSFSEMVGELFKVQVYRMLIALNW